MHLPARQKSESKTTGSDVTIETNVEEKIASNDIGDRIEFGVGRGVDAPVQEKNSYNLAWTSILKMMGLDVHQQINADALPEMSSEQRILLDVATVLVDELQQSSESYMHAMQDGDDSKMTKTEAMQKSNAWIRYNLYQSAVASSKGNMVTALFNEGIAIHALQDSTSPSHRDSETGNLKEWTTPKGFLEKIIWFFSGLDHVSHEAHNPGVGSNAYKVTRDVHKWLSDKYVPEGNLIRQYGVDVLKTEDKIQSADRVSPLYSGPTETG